MKEQNINTIISDKVTLKNLIKDLDTTVDKTDQCSPENEHAASAVFGALTLLRTLQEGGTVSEFFEKLEKEYCATLCIHSKYRA